MTPSAKYKIASLATNNEGSSELGEYVMIGATELPQAPSTVLKNEAKSDKTTIFLEWSEVADPDLPITGYIL